MAESRSASETEPIHSGNDAAFEEPLVAVHPAEFHDPVAVRRGLIDVPGDPLPILEHAQQLGSRSSRQLRESRGRST